MSEQAVVLDTSEGMAWYYLCTLKMALSLHSKGIKMTRNAPNPYKVAQSYGYTGTRKAIYAAVMEDVASHTIPSVLLEALKQRRGEA